MIHLAATDEPTRTFASLSVPDAPRSTVWIFADEPAARAADVPGHLTGEVGTSVPPPVTTSTCKRPVLAVRIRSHVVPLKPSANAPTPGTVGLEVASASAAAAGSSESTVTVPETRVTSTSRPFVVSLRKRSQVEVFQPIRKEPTAGAVGLEVASANAAAAGSSESTVTVAALAARLTLMLVPEATPSTRRARRDEIRTEAN